MEGIRMILSWFSHFCLCRTNHVSLLRNLMGFPSRITKRRMHSSLSWFVCWMPRGWPLEFLARFAIPLCMLQHVMPHEWSFNVAFNLGKQNIPPLKYCINLRLWILNGLHLIKYSLNLGYWCHRRKDTAIQESRSESLRENILLYLFSFSGFRIKFRPSCPRRSYFALCL